ncbi:polymerase delta-interacting protein 3-like isoform X1 [Ornithodoros turicata]|uniref:polymerase delta-interacting protein 3-like isoform X1 n=1 Tax=Ornithodoros turicata TaxID=34597 RepID=UPI00313876F2
MVLSRKLANRIGVRTQQKGNFRRPNTKASVTDARQVLNAKGLRRQTQSSFFNARTPAKRFGGVTKAYRAQQQTGRNAFRGDARAFINAARAAKAPAKVQQSRFQTGVQPNIQIRQGLLTVTKKRQLFNKRLQVNQGDLSDEEQPIPQNPNKRIRVNRTGISVTTVNNVAKIRRHNMVVDNDSYTSEDEDDLERLTLEDVIGRSPLASDRLFRPSGSRVPVSKLPNLERFQKPTPMMIEETDGRTSKMAPVSRIQHRLDVNPVPSSSRPAMLTEPAEGASVLVSNLHPQVTESDIRDLFQDIGPMQEARLVSTGTALATFYRRATAIRACDTYHGRLLDGQPMNLTLLTVGTTASSSQRPAQANMSSYFASKYL